MNWVQSSDADFFHHCILCKAVELIKTRVAALAKKIFLKAE